MAQHYNQNYSQKDIATILAKIKSCIINNKYTISLNKNRQENINFINEYNIHSKKQKNLLLNLQVKDFCYTLQNTNPGYEYEILYVFVPKVSLFNSDGINEIIDIYMKFNIIELPYGTRTIVISFHKKNKPISYLFK
ncbi:hypothetical protein [Pectinatus sottacetonis]|uniref:hypothetical protein n=1 Tax=Pectinatus sottacetonis TaxID=1002795 RepID=UPI0018C6ACB0|nr:hypothetical protein [Pectinatus sottacetonis]